MITKEKLSEAGSDLDTIKDVVNGPANLNGNGNVTSRLGTSLKTIAKIISDMNASVTSMVNAGNTAINSMISTSSASIATLISTSNANVATMIANGTTAITNAINNGYAQVVTGGAPILSSESAAQLPAIESGSVTNKQIVNLKGWHTANDGGGQTLIYDSTSTATVNGGTVFPGPGGTLSFDPTTGAFNGTVGTGRYLALETRRLTPERFGAKGDGVTDDSKAIQRCIDYAAAEGNCSIDCSPRIVYGLGSTLILGGTNLIEIKGSIGEISQNSTVHGTFLKLADILAIEITGAHYLHNIKITGRGSTLPQNTPADTETKPAIVIRGKSRLNEVSVFKCGGLYDGVETNTDGYAIGIVQQVGGNANYCSLEKIGITSCKGGVYICRHTGAIQNVNAIRVTVDNFMQSTGICINAENGFRNHFEVRHAESASDMTTAVFRLNYVENYAYCQYAEGTIPVGVIFGPSAGRNHVEFLDSGAFGVVQTGMTNDSLRDIQANAWIGKPYRSDIEGQYGTAFDLRYGSTLGGVTWTTRSVIVSSFARLINMSIIFVGAQNVASNSIATLRWDAAIFPFVPERTAATMFPAVLTNSNGTQIVYLYFSSDIQFAILNSEFQALSFNAVTGTGSFTLTASISAQRKFFS